MYPAGTDPYLVERVVLVRWNQERMQQLVHEETMGCDVLSFSWVHQPTNPLTVYGSLLPDLVAVLTRWNQERMQQRVQHEKTMGCDVPSFSWVHQPTNPLHDKWVLCLVTKFTSRPVQEEEASH